MGWGGGSRLTTGLITFLSLAHHGVGRGVQAHHRSDHLSQSNPSWGGVGGSKLVTGLITFLSPTHHGVGWGGGSKLTTGLLMFLSLTYRPTRGRVTAASLPTKFNSYSWVSFRVSG